MPDSVWTPVALSSDLPPRLVIPTTLNGQDIAVWRSESGKVHAWNDRCPHRGMRLSHGFVRGELLSCIYHGWRYDGEGICRKIPAHPDLEPPTTIRVPSWRCEEAGGVIWVAAADAEGMPHAATGFEPLRSIRVDAQADEVTEAIAATDADWTIYVQPMADGAILHALMPEGASLETRIAASRALEFLRLTLEAGKDAA